MDWWSGRPFALGLLSILAFAAWLVFILFYALFWSRSFSFFQNIIVTIVSFLLMGLLVSLMWFVWGRRFMKPTEA